MISPLSEQGPSIKQFNFPPSKDALRQIRLSNLWLRENVNVKSLHWKMKDISEKYELMTHCEPYTKAIVSTHVPLGPKWLWLELYVHGSIH